MRLACEGDERLAGALHAETVFWHRLDADLTPPTPAQKRRLRKIEREFHVRAFGEELARINFLPEKSARRRWRR